jgi:hypothetical protein
VWRPEELLERLEPTVTLTLGEHPVKIQAWCYWIIGVTVHKVPAYFLDTDVPDNAEWERTPAEIWGRHALRHRCQGILF